MFIGEHIRSLSFLHQSARHGLVQKRANRRVEEKDMYE